MSNEQEELVVHVPLQNYDLTGITESWWDSSYGLNTAMNREKDWEGKEVHLCRSGLNV